MQRLQLRDGLVLNRINAHNRAAKTDGDKIEISGNQVAPVGLYGYYQRNKYAIDFSGFGSRDNYGNAINGRIGNHEGGKTLGEGQVAAKGACLNFLNNLATVCDGDLDGVKSLALRVDINCDPDFKDLPKVANGASQLLIDVFGKFIGTPVRTAAGSSSLPNGMMVEITGTVLITKELAARLDIRDAQNLLTILSWTNRFIEPGVDSSEQISEELCSVNKLTKQHYARLQIYVANTCAALEKLDIEINADAWIDFARSNGFLDKVESKQDLIDLLSSKAKNLNLTLSEEQLSKYSSLYGTITKARQEVPAATNNEPVSTFTNAFQPTKL